MMEGALFVVSAVLAHATYLACPPERIEAHREWCRTVIIVCVRRIRHHGRWLVWQVAVITRVPHRRAARRASRDDV
jgi:hypothetical protein